jgi:phosphatidylserine decarboxylase
LTSHAKYDGDDAVPDVSPEVPPLHWRAILHFMRFLPQGALSRGFGHIADVPLPHAARSSVLGAFARAMGIDASEAEHGLRDYNTINEFFVRRLRTGARSIDPRAGHVVSPVDGVIGQAGFIANGALLQAKGRTYTTAALLDDASVAAPFEGGTFITIYLSPRHYHRIHAPASGVIRRAVHIPGTLFPVNAPSVQHIDNLFPRNERLIAYISDGAVHAAVVAVGAYNVGRISAAFDRAWQGGNHVTNRAKARREERVYEPGISVAAGEEIMAFHLGSTVVLLFNRRIVLGREVYPGSEVRMGQSLGSGVA